MRLIGKLVIPLVGATIIVGSCSGNIFAEKGTESVRAVVDYKIGDDMPKFSDEQKVGERKWYNSDWTKWGMSLDYDLDGDGIPEVSLTYRNCKEKKLFFGLYDLVKEILYLDKKPYDGKIDQVVIKVAGRLKENDAPNCALKVKK